MKIHHKSLVPIALSGGLLLWAGNAFADCSDDYIAKYKACVSDNLPGKSTSQEQAKTSPQTTCINEAYQKDFLVCLEKKAGEAAKSYYKQNFGKFSVLLAPEVECRQRAINTLTNENTLANVWNAKIKEALLKCADDPVLKTLKDEEAKFPKPEAPKPAEPPKPAEAPKKAAEPPKPVKDTGQPKKPGGDKDTPEPEKDELPPPAKEAEKTFSTTIDKLVVDYHKFVELDKANAKECASKKIIDDQRNCRKEKLAVSNANRATMDAEAKAKGAIIQAQIDTAYAEYVKVDKKKADAWKAKQDKILGSGISSHNSLATVYKRMKGSELERWDAFVDVADKLIKK